MNDSVRRFTLRYVTFTNIQRLDKKYQQHCCHMKMVSSRAASFVYMNEDIR